MKYTRSFYCKKITQAVNFSNKGKKIYGNEVRFHDDLDWQVIDNKGVWTDVFLEIGRGRGGSVFAFTACSSFASQDHVTGCVPEFERDLESGLWDLYMHQKYISHRDVGYLCKKWVELQSPIEGILGCNVYFNGKRCGYTWASQQYPRDQIVTSLDDIYGIERYTPIKMSRGVCS